MSNTQLWLKTIEDLAAIVDSARYSIPLEEMFEDERLYYPMKESVSDFDMASWLMFDTLENRETTNNLIHQFWRHLHEMRGVDPYLEKLFDSYLSIYRVNYIAENGIYVQNMAFREHAKILQKTDETKMLSEGDIFFGRVIESSVGNFAFRISSKVPEDMRETFSDNFFEMIHMQPQLEGDPDVYKQSLKDGNPDLMFLFVLSMEKAREDQHDNFIYDWSEGDGEGGIYRLATELSEDSEVAVSDIYVLERLESKLLIRSGESFEDEGFTDYDGLFEEASREGEFTDDAQLVRMLDIFERGAIEEENEAAAEAIRSARENLLAYKSNLENSVAGIYRSKDLDRAVRATSGRYVPFIAHYDRYLETFLNHEMEATKTGALNRKSLDYLMPLVNNVDAKETRTLREGSFPVLVLFRKFAELKGLVARDDERFEVTTRMDQYMQFSQEEKLSLWLTTLLSPHLYAHDLYFRAWPVATMWSRFTDEAYVEKLLTEPSSDTRATRIKASIIRMGQDMNLYRLDFDDRYYATMSPLGEGVLKYIGARKRDNVVSLFDR
ncbi:MAG: hypothetical protein SPI65_06875 [Peptoniphilus sp.]|nr:hypothetical protein [Peptoniphilus sp.]MDD7363013.1 hypothetical protein [Bacillota bacterium]MDY6045278.1 hypothetical protein [Peptoniphilus sp.]